MALSDKVGFYYCMFTGTPSGKYLKCYEDGNQQYSYRTPEELYALAELEGPNPSLKAALRDAFSCTGMYMWDVDGNTIESIPLKSLSSGQSDLAAHTLAAVQGKQQTKDKDSFALSSNPMKNDNVTESVLGKLFNKLPKLF